MTNWYESILDEANEAHRYCNPNPHTDTGNKQVRRSQAIVSAGKLVALGLLAIADAVKSSRELEKE